MSQFEKFSEFHFDNLHVYELYERLSLEVFNTGRTKFSTNLVINQMRWEEIFETSDRTFKISNNHAPYYSRLFMKINPQCKGFFQINSLDEFVSRKKWDKLVKKTTKKLGRK